MRIQATAASLLLILGLIGWQVQAGLTSPVCNYKLFPIFAGGNKDEWVNSQEMDPDSGYIFVGGMTQSANFAPAENDHGFVYALD